MPQAPGQSPLPGSHNRLLPQDNHDALSGFDYQSALHRLADHDKHPQTALSTPDCNN